MEICNLRVRSDALFQEAVRCVYEMLATLLMGVEGAVSEGARWGRVGVVKGEEVVVKVRTDR